MVHAGAEVGLRRLIQIQNPALSCLCNHSALAGLHGSPELSYAALELFSLLVAIGIRVAVVPRHSIGDTIYAVMEPLLAHSH
jgi:hypothetical protein